MNNRLYISLAGAMLLLVAMCGCIKNDLPYGKVPLSITAFSVSGQTGDAVISDKDLTVTVNLEETAMKSLFEQMGGTYTLQSDHYLPNLTLPIEENKPIGIWGQRHLRYCYFQSSCLSFSK